MTEKLNVKNISIEGVMDILMYNATDCYKQSGMPLEINTKPRLSVPSFTVSITKNKFVAVGCDTYTYLNGILNDEPFSIGCLSKCNNTHNIVNGICFGIVSWQIDIPKGLKNIDFAAYSFNSHKEVWYLSRYRTIFQEQLRKEKQSNTFLTNFWHIYYVTIRSTFHLGFCKVKFNQSSCWLFSILNFFVF